MSVSVRVFKHAPKTWSKIELDSETVDKFSQEIAPVGLETWSKIELGSSSWVVELTVSGELVVVSVWWVGFDGADSLTYSGSGCGVWAIGTR